MKIFLSLFIGLAMGAAYAEMGIEGAGDAQTTISDYTVNGDSAEPVSRHIPSFNGNFHAAFGIFDFLDLGLVLPFHYDLINPELGESDESGIGIGDLQP